MTIFHVIKYPVPDWSTASFSTAVLSLPEALRKKFELEFDHILNKHRVNCPCTDAEIDTAIDEVLAEFTSTYIRLLLEYEE